MKLIDDAFKEYVRNKENDMTIGEYNAAKKAFSAAASYVINNTERLSKDIIDKADSMTYDSRLVKPTRL